MSSSSTNAPNISPRGSLYQQGSSICWECLGVDPAKLADFQTTVNPSFMRDRIDLAKVEWDNISQGCTLCVGLKSFLRVQSVARTMQATSQPLLQLQCQLVKVLRGPLNCLLYRLWIGDDIIQEANIYRNLFNYHLAAMSPDLIMAKKWLHHCQDHHNSCGRAGKFALPLKVIDCLQRKLVSIMDVSAVSYACLSYVWGTAQSNDNFHFSSLVAFPKTIEDAIYVTKQLGIQYLWIDRYCIEPVDSEERQFLIRNMDIIYRGAAITIIAACGNNPDHGLPGVNDTPQLVRGQQLFAAGASGIPLIGFLNPSIEISNSTWAFRGWTFQEMVLSRRRLVFTNTQIYFQCKTEHVMENLSAGTTKSILNTRDYAGERQDSFHLTCLAEPDGRHDPRAATVWSRINDYYARELTFSKDVIQAFLGVFYISEGWKDSQRPEVTHLYGLPLFYPSKACPAIPTSTLAISLAWAAHFSGRKFRPKVESDLFPSWTWARTMADRQVRENRDHDHGRLYFELASNETPGIIDIKIFVHPQQGGRIDVDQYASSGLSFENCHPWIDVDSWVASCYLLKHRNTAHYSVKYLKGVGQPGSTYWDYQDTPPTGELILVFLAAKGVANAKLFFLIVEKSSPLAYRRVGMYTNATSTIPTEPDVPSLLRSWHADGVWERRTVRLV